MAIFFGGLFWTVLRRFPKLITSRGLYTQTQPKTDLDQRSGINRLRGRSVFVRHLDTGSSNSAEVAIAALQNPAFDLERLGFHIVASPRHADILLVTGPVTYNLIPATEATFDAMPERPRYIVTVGDDAEDGGIFQEAYGVFGFLPREDMQAARIGHVPGLSPTPLEILKGLCAAVDAQRRKR